jgi:RNA polymerase sigma factor (sigma-70 family)
MAAPEKESIQRWLDRHRAGECPPPADLCYLCMDRVRTLVQPRLKRFPMVQWETQTTEVLNRTLLKLLKALPKMTFETVVDFERYIALTIRRVLIDKSRVLKVRRSHVQPGGGLSSAEEQLGDHPLSDEEMAEFHRRVEELPAADRDYFDLLYYHGLKTAEAAVKLGVPPTTLKRNWARLRYEMAQHFNKDLTKL